MPLTIKRLTGSAVRDVLDDLARLRIQVFRDWPYLYDGSLAYEAKYLARYGENEGAVIVCAFDGDRLVGASTGEPLGDELEEFRGPFEAAGLRVDEIFYLAESVLDPSWRGRGIGHRFFDEREAHARELGFTQATFCAVERPDDHPMKPADYRPLDDFWRGQGYRPLESPVIEFPWLDVGETEETMKPMKVWLRTL